MTIPARPVPDREYTAPGRTCPRRLAAQSLAGLWGLRWISRAKAPDGTVRAGGTAPLGPAFKQVARLPVASRPAIASAAGRAELQAFWRDLRRQERENVRRLKQRIGEEIQKGCFGILVSGRPSGGRTQTCRGIGSISTSNTRGESHAGSERSTQGED